MTGPPEELTLAAWQERQVLGAGVQNALQLQLAQLAIVDNVVCDALIQRIGGARELYRAACRCPIDSSAPRLSLKQYLERTWQGLHLSEVASAIEPG